MTKECTDLESPHDVSNHGTDRNDGLCHVDNRGEQPQQNETAAQIETATGRGAANAGTASRTVHNKVQLWEDGPYWADTNIGAEKPEDYGFYFWWGDTVGYKHVGKAWVASDGSTPNFEFGKNHTQTSGKSLATLLSDGWVIGGDEKISFLEHLLEKLFALSIREHSVLTSPHDAAQVHWGGEWRMPTNQELKDLCKKCDWTWTNVNGVDGYTVRGRGDYASGSIFLPSAGFGHETLLGHVGSTGAYWASVPHSDFSNSEAWDLGFNSGRHSVSYYYRYFGQPIRPVQGFTK